MNHRMNLILSGSLIVMLLTGMQTPKSVQKPKPGKFLITANEKAKRIDITVNGKPFTSYIYPDFLKKPVLYPIRTVNGTPVTRGWPIDSKPGERIDHPHHVGLWFNFGDVNGHDFWNNSNDIKGHKGPFGTIIHRGINKMVNGEGRAELDVTMDWLNSDSTRIIREDTKYIFSANGDDRIIDRITTLTALEDIFFKDNKEGMFAMRIARELEQPANKAEILIDKDGNPAKMPVLDNSNISGKYYSSEGKEGDDVWGTRAKWVTLNGRIKDEAISLIIFDSPKNTGFPGSWHARGYGLFGVNPFGQKAMGSSKEEFNFNLPKGKSVTFKHRLIVHSGSPLNKDLIEKKFREFSEK